MSCAKRLAGSVSICTGNVGAIDVIADDSNAGNIASCVLRTDIGSGAAHYVK